MKRQWVIQTTSLKQLSFQSVHSRQKTALGHYTTFDEKKPDHPLVFPKKVDLIPTNNDFSGHLLRKYEEFVYNRAIARKKTYTIISISSRYDIGSVESETG